MRLLHLFWSQTVVLLIKDRTSIFFVLSVKLLTMCNKQIQASVRNSEEPIAYRGFRLLS